LNRFLDFSLLIGQQIDTKLLGHIHKVSPGVTVAFRELIDQLLDAKSGSGQRNLRVAFFDLDLLVECFFKCLLQVRGDAGILSGTALRVWRRSSFLELAFNGRATRTDLVLAVG
jgi:hypothetical protein